MPGRLFYGFEAETVLDPQTLIEGESLLSWIARTTLENDLPHMTTIFRDVGQVHRNCVVAIMRGDVDVDGLATILGTDRSAVDTLRGQRTGRDAMRYLNAVVRPGDMHTAARRFAPGTLARDAVPHYRASWLIRTMPVCTETWQAFRTRCDCGAKQTWYTMTSMIFCDACGEDLRTLRADELPTEYRPGLKTLSDLLVGGEDRRSAARSSLPTELAALDAGDVFEVALLVARIVDPTMGCARKNVWRDDPIRLAKAMSQAADLLPHWPDTLWRAVGLSGDLKAMRQRTPALLALYRVLNLEYSHTIATPIAETLTTMKEALILNGTDSQRLFVDLAGAEKIVRVAQTKIFAERAAGRLAASFAISHGEIGPAFDRKELEAIAETLGWPCASLVGKRLNLPPYAIEQLCSMDEMLWAKSPHRTLRTRLRVDPKSVGSFERALQSAAVSIAEIDEPVSLNTVMRGIGGREKPWGPVLRLLLSGDLPYAIQGSTRTVRAVRIARADVEAVRAVVFDMSAWALFPFSDLLVQRDACDILNVADSRRYDIEKLKTGERRGAWLFDRAAIVREARRIVTGVELGARHLIGCKPTGVVIRRAKLEAVEFGFDRQVAEVAFADALNARSAEAG